MWLEVGSNQRSKMNSVQLNGDLMEYFFVFKPSYSFGVDDC